MTLPDDPVDPVDRPRPPPSSETARDAPPPAEAPPPAVAPVGSPSPAEPPPELVPATPTATHIGWRSGNSWQLGGPGALLPATVAVRGGPIVHPRSASFLLAMGTACAIGALLATSALLAALLRADPAVRRLGTRDDWGSSAVGLLVLSSIFLAIAFGVERRWTRRLAALRPPPTVPAPSESERKHRRLAVAGRLVALRAMWTTAPDPTFDFVARAWAGVVWVSFILGAFAAIAVAVGDGRAVRIGVGLAIAAEWLLVLDAIVGWALARRLGGYAERRAIQALVGRADEPVRPDWRFHRSALLLVPLLANLVVGSAAWAVATAPDRSDCPALGPGCHFVTVPFDRTQPNDPRTIDIAYRVAPSTGTGHRLLIVAVGGPGDSGLDEMTARLDEIGPGIRDAFDIVFFDQRGVGASDGLRCPTAAHGTEATSGLSERDSAARTFAEACVRETGHAAADMAVYATSQAAEDVDAIRAALGYERFVLYGESYGTRLAQTYAARHPGRLEALILDGAIDPASDGRAFWAESAAGFDHSLKETLDACTSDQACKNDLRGKDPMVVLGDVLRNAQLGSLISIPTAHGLTDQAVFRSEMAGAIESALYTEGGRAELQRAVAAAANGDTTLLGRLVLVDRETSSGGRSRWGAGGGGRSIAAYFAIERADYEYAPGDAGAAAFAAGAARRRTPVGSSTPSSRRICLAPTGRSMVGRWGPRRSRTCRRSSSQPRPTRSPLRATPNASWRACRTPLSS